MGQEQELDASKPSDEAEWQREFKYLHLREFESAKAPESSIDFNFLRKFELPGFIKDGPSLVERSLELRQREGDLQRLSETLLSE